MSMKRSKTMTSWILCAMLIVAMAWTTVGFCESERGGAPAAEAAVQPEVTVLGEGQTVFMLTVVDMEGSETHFEIHTDKETVGDALLELELIDGEVSQYGLYVKVVNGITADYDVNKTYWAFYIDGEYGFTGVDVTKVEAGAAYALKVEK